MNKGTALRSLRRSRARPLGQTPPPTPKPGHQGSLFAEDDDPDPRRTQEIAPDFLEFARREEIDEPEPVWEP